MVDVMIQLIQLLTALVGLAAAIAEAVPVVRGSARKKKGRRRKR